jgi:hypothetical protein
MTPNRSLHCMVVAFATFAACSNSRDTTTPSAGSHSSRSCSNGEVSRVKFEAEWRSANNDALLMSYGYCSTSSGCSSGYRNAGCTWRAERSSSDSLPHELAYTMTNDPNYRNFCKYLRPRQVTCHSTSRRRLAAGCGGGAPVNSSAAKSIRAPRRSRGFAVERC